MDAQIVMEAPVEGTYMAVGHPVLLVLLGLAGGALAGLVHFGSLSWNARLYASASLSAAIGVQLVRFALLIAILAGAARLGAPALLSGALAILAMRSVVIRRVARAA